MMRVLLEMKWLGCVVGCGFLIGCVPVTPGTGEPESTMMRDSENYLEAEDAH